MNRRNFIKSGALAGGAVLARSSSVTAAVPPTPAPLPPPIPLSASGAFDPGTKAQLFIDQQTVLSTERVSFTAHPGTKHPANPLVRHDRPWEGWRINIYGTALFDEEEQLFKMWYGGHTSDAFPDFATHYATSRDGVHWDKPNVGTEKVAGLPHHNAVLAHCQIASVMKDNADPDPNRRYKMVAMDHRVKPTGGPHALVSPDGLAWTRISTQNLFRSNDVATAYHDSQRKLYVALPKLSTPVRGTIRRCFGVCTSPDLLKWTDSRLTLQPDVRDDAGTLARIAPMRFLLDVADDPALMRTEFYGLGVYPTESCTVGFPWVFSINNNARFPTNRPTRNHDGPCEIQLAVSREPGMWERPIRTPVVPLGKPGEWDSGFLTTASHAFRYRDEIRLYYGGANYTHGNPTIYDEYTGNEQGTKYTSAIGLATWLLDRFVSADAGADGGILTTVPLHISGTRLELNVNASKGSVAVEILDPAGKPMTGFGRSDLAKSDSLRQTISWQGNPDLSSLRGKPIMLRFAIKNAELFSFALRET